MDTQSVGYCLSCPKGLWEVKVETQVGEHGGFYNSLNLSLCSPKLMQSTLMCIVSLTQQDPQEPWSLICWIVGQLGHCWRGSKLSGSFMPSTLWSLYKRGQSLSNADKKNLLIVTWLSMWETAHINTRLYTWCRALQFKLTPLAAWVHSVLCHTVLSHSSYQRYESSARPGEKSRVRIRDN